MMEENVVSSAGTTHRATIADMERSIRDAGYAVRRRRQDYSIIQETAGAAA
jgi:2-iminoacetate synthase ThiH